MYKMHFACERDQMMFTKARNVNIPYEHHLVVIFRKHGIVYYILHT